MAVRGVLYRLILRMEGMAAIENGVRLRCADTITLGHGAYLDQHTYLHGGKGGIRLGRARSSCTAPCCTSTTSAICRTPASPSA